MQYSFLLYLKMAWVQKIFLKTFTDDYSLFFSLGFVVSSEFSTKILYPTPFLALDRARNLQDFLHNLPEPEFIFSELDC